MKLVIKGGLVALALSAIACDDGTTKDPATTGRSDLNPPTGLTTVTWDKKIELRWKAANAEEAFKGYHVFAVADKTVADVGTPAYPKNLTIDLNTGAIPRCVDNTAIFELFGFTASDADCEGDAEPAADAAGTDSTLMADEAAADAPEVLDNIVQCDEHNDATISYPAEAPNLGDMICTVSKIGETALENGKTYTFFVTAVAGDEKNEISWTSNFVSDTPAASLFQTDAFKIEGAGSKGYLIPVAKLTGLTAFTADDIVDTACADAFCKVLQTNNLATDGIYIGRLGGATSYPQRAFISVPNTGALKLVPRGQQVLDPKDGSFQNSIPGDRAADTTYGAGKLYPIYGNQVFDLEVTIGAAKHYGKIVFGQPTLATATDAASDITVPMGVIMQTDAGNHDYFTSDSLEF